MTIAILGAATITSESTSYLILETTAKNLKEGEVFSLDVKVYAHKPVNAIDLAIAYPKSQIQVRGIDSGESVITLWTKDPYVENNTVYLSGGTFRKGFVGEHFIARINAIALKSGSADIVAENIQLLAGDGSGTEIPVSNTDSAVRVQIANKEGELVGSVNVTKIITDIDGDGKVDFTDILQFMSAWFGGEIVYDFSGDGKMTFKDFSIILSDAFTK